MIKVTSEADKVCVAKAREAGQGHVFDSWDDLPPEDQRALIQQVEAVDFQLLGRLTRQYLNGRGLDAERRVLKPAATQRLPKNRTVAERRRLVKHRQVGEEALAAGKIRLVMVSGAGAVGPLGEPVGLLPVGPVSGKSLFQLQAEKIRALNRRCRATLHWSIVTHPGSHDQVVEFFKKENFFGLGRSDVAFLPQPLLPLVDKRGRLLMTEPGRLALRPNGHGGVLLELCKKEYLDQLDEAGVEHLFFFQADNPLVKIADPIFIGDHILSLAEVSSKAILKQAADEEVGVFCRSSSGTGVVEHSELSDEDRTKSADDGTLEFGIGNMAVHIFHTAFLRRLVEETIQLPFHAVERTVPCVSKKGRRRQPTAPNCVEFRCFLFDALWEAQRGNVFVVEREDEFSPIKSIGGTDSPQTAQCHLSRLYTRWLRDAGATFTNSGAEGPTIEISPLYALDEEELTAKIELPLEIREDTLLDGN